jgi:hypothetical protein
MTKNASRVVEHLDGLRLCIRALWVLARCLAALGEERCASLEECV